jgi:DnaJ-class molecular chaperone
VPVGVQHGETVILAGEGMPKKGGGRGDLRVMITLRATELEKTALKANREKLEEIFKSGSEQTT